MKTGTGLDDREMGRLFVDLCAAFIGKGRQDIQAAIDGARDALGLALPPEEHARESHDGSRSEAVTHLLPRSGDGDGLHAACGFPLPPTQAGQPLPPPNQATVDVWGVTCLQCVNATEEVYLHRLYEVRCRKAQIDGRDGDE